MVFGPVVQYRALLRDGKAHWIWRRDLATVMDRLSARIKNYLPSSIARAPAPVDVIAIHEQAFIEQSYFVKGFATDHGKTTHYDIHGERAVMWKIEHVLAGDKTIAFE